MAKVETSGVVLTADCDIKSDVCTAKDAPAPLTAVWAPPGRTQVNVCRACLEERIRAGLWEVEGARVRPRD
jgi:hypothetical protein